MINIQTQLVAGFLIRTSDVLDRFEKSESCRHNKAPAWKFCPECGLESHKSIRYSIKKEFQEYLQMPEHDEFIKYDDLLVLPLWWTTQKIGGYSIFSLNEEPGQIRKVDDFYILGFKLKETNINSDFLDQEMTEDIHMNILNDNFESMRLYLKSLSIIKYGEPILKLIQYKEFLDDPK